MSNNYLQDNFWHQRDSDRCKLYDRGVCGKCLPHHRNKVEHPIDPEVCISWRSTYSVAAVAKSHLTLGPRESPPSSSSHGLDRAWEHSPALEVLADDVHPAPAWPAARSSVVFRWRLELVDDTSNVKIKCPLDVTKLANTAPSNGAEDSQMAGPPAGLLVAHKPN